MSKSTLEKLIERSNDITVDLQTIRSTNNRYDASPSLRHAISHQKQVSHWLLTLESQLQQEAASDPHSH